MARIAVPLLDQARAQDVIVIGAATARVHHLAQRASRSQLPILVLGETGTGKELLARAIHHSSERSAGPLCAINCGALPPTLVQSVLFGYERGAFTGAMESRPGLFERAHGGTLFLDEIGELAPEAQVAILRVLDTKTVSRIGRASEGSVDVRIIAATHRNLGAMCREKRFREDLLYRLSSITLTLPPLRERSDEIPELVRHFLSARELPADCPRSITPDAMEYLSSYDWPGNVRELRNVVMRAAVLSHSETIHLADVTDALAAAIQLRDSSASVSELDDELSSQAGSAIDFNERVRSYELMLIRRALAESGGHKTNAAKRLKMPLRTFMKRIYQYDID